MRAPMRVDRWLTRAPRWVRLVLAVPTAVIGAVLLVRPTTSLGVLALLIGAGLVLHGVGDLVGGTRMWSRRLMALLWVVAGLVVLVLPGLTVRLLAVLVGVGLVLHGALLLLGALSRRAPSDERGADGAFGVAGIGFGVLALSWPDITALVVAVTFGARLVLAALTLGWLTLRRPREPARRRRRRWVRSGAAVVSVTLAAGSAALSVSLNDGSTVTDDFYAPPRDVPDSPGELVRAEHVTRGVPEGAEAWRILYTTTRGDGSPAVASGLVVVPTDGEGPWPVIDWNHGTTGVAQHCAPSLAAEPFESGALMVLPEVLAEGWALVATDYIGLGTQGPHPYLIGPDSAHASLDAVRAARRLTDAELAEETVVWGHSQGGGAALWAGALLAEYAPELEVVGVAALAPASDLRGLVGGLDGVTGGSVLASFVASAYTAEYDDVTYRQYVRPGAEVVLREMAGRCLAPPGVLVSVLTTLALSREPTILAGDPSTGAFGERLAQNEPPARVPVPLLIGQGGADRLITPDVQRGFVGRLCTAGVAVDYRQYPGRDHLALVEPDSPLVPELLDWTRDRFTGAPATDRCPTGR